MSLIHIRMINVALICLLSVIHCYSQNFYSSKDTVVLSGKLSTRYFKDANNHPEKVFLLKLSRPINVSKDEFGEQANDIRTIQIIFDENILYPGILHKGINLPKKYFSSTVTITGLLFHQITAHHHKRIIMKVLNISTK